MHLSGRGFGTMAIARETRVSKLAVWRWQEAYLKGGVERLRKDKGKGLKAGKPRISNFGAFGEAGFSPLEQVSTPTHFDHLWHYG